MGGSGRKVYKRDFWINENLNYTRPHFRLEKSARIINKLAMGKECDLLDIGCGPATLKRLLNHRIHYYGIDIAIHDPAPNLIEMDFLEAPIKFGNRRFDIITAQGVFEYIGDSQLQKFAEIAQLLNDGGNFIVSYVNFDHRDRRIYWPYSNVQSFHEFRTSLMRYFSIDKLFPTSHHWVGREPNWRLLQSIQMPITVSFPIISRLFAVEYFFVCSARGSKSGS
jgi:cyclopropane fatty-acyl-phospholipid synthase-like methyltransferase